MIHEEICTYEVCKLAKEKGFPQDGHHKYYEFGGSRLFTPTYKGAWYRNSPIPNTCVAAPTQSLLQRWLREEKGYYVYPYYDNNEFKWTYSTREKTGDMWILLVGETPNFDEYEEAMEAGLKFVLENFV